MRRFLPLLGWLGGLAAAAAVLTVAGHGALAGPPLTDPARWPAWAAQRPPLDAAVAALRTGLLGVVWYLVGATALSLAARAAALPRLVVAVDILAVPVVRRVVHRAVGAGLVVTTLAGPAHAADTAPIPPPPAEAADSSTPTLRYVPDTPPPSPPPAAEPTWVVAPGDHLWRIARTSLERAWRRPPTDAEIVPYWRALIALNRDRLAIPDEPDLVYPGQVFRLPPPPPAA